MEVSDSVNPDVVLESINTAALVLGYPTLFIFIGLLVWFAAILCREVFRIVRASNYERWQQEREMRDVDNIEASWALELDEDNRTTKHDTDVLEFPIPGLSDEQVYDQLKEQR